MRTLHKGILIVGIGAVLIGVLWGSGGSGGSGGRLSSADQSLQTLDTITRAGYTIELTVRMDLIIDPATGLGYWGRLWTAKATRDGVGVSVSGEGFEETVCKLLEGLLN